MSKKKLKYFFSIKVYKKDLADYNIYIVNNKRNRIFRALNFFLKEYNLTDSFYCINSVSKKYTLKSNGIYKIQNRLK